MTRTDWSPTSALLVPILLLAFAPAAGAAAILGCDDVPPLMRSYLQHHVEYRERTDELERRTLETWLHRADPQRTALLQSEVEELMGFAQKLFDEIDEGNCTRLTALHQKLVARHREVEKFVREFVGDENYAVDPDAVWVVDTDDRGYPKSKREQRDLIRSQVHFQMSNYLATDTPLAEAKEHLIHRYELRTQRFADLDREELLGHILDAFAASLDPHSNYLSRDVLEDFRIQMSLSLEGIGVALSERDGYAVVERIIPGGAAAKLDVLRPKDKLIAVAPDGDEEYVSIIDMPLREAVSLIRGKKGTTVRLTVLRQGEVTERFPVEIVRDTISLEEQAASLRWVEREREEGTLKLAVLELPSFYGDTDPSKRQCTEDVARLLREVVEKNADGLVLDLSRNGGGLLEHAVTVAGFFIRKGEIVGVKGARGKQQVLSDRDSSVLYSGPLVVHTSRVSASASEIVAGALKDYKRAVIAGDDHTFGKGTVQTITTLPESRGALKVTTALFFRPGGKSTQNDGVRADIVIPSLLATDDFGESNQPFALMSERIPEFRSSYANAAPTAGRWTPVTEEIVTELALRSTARVSASEIFGEVREKLREQAEKGGVIKLSEVEKERAEAEARQSESNGDGHGPADGKSPADGTKDAESDGAAAGSNGDSAAVAEVEPEMSPQLEEAIDVLADLVELTAMRTASR